MYNKIIIHLCMYMDIHTYAMVFFVYHVHSYLYMLVVLLLFSFTILREVADDLMFCILY